MSTLVSIRVPPRGGPVVDRELPPTTRAEMDARGWKELDILVVSGDAYVDHPTFGTAMIARVLEAQGYRVGVVSQPDWRSTHDFARLGRPRLFAGVTSGCMDSMVNHYTAAKRRRSDDAYTPGGEAGRRPDRAATVYARRLREAFGETLPIVIGGVEGSLRRLAHYDYWDDALRPSILCDSRADLVVYGQGEKPIIQIARRLAQGEDVCGLTDVPGTAVLLKDMALLGERTRPVLELPDWDAVRASKETFATFSRLYHLEHNADNARVMLQRHGDDVVVVNEPMPNPSTEELDAFYELPFLRRPHLAYGDRRIPAFEQIRWSINIMRGCAAGCSFCCITEHQGRDVASRSEASVLREIRQMTDLPDFRGTVSDIGGATANMWQMTCTSEKAHKACRRLSCVYPSVCQFFKVDHGPLVQLYRKARAIPGVKHAFVASGVRYDLAHADEENGQTYLRELIGNHVSGQLKVAPEHISKDVVHVMKKPGKEDFERFREEFERYSAEAGKEQYLIPYFISSHPGCKLDDAVELMEYLRANDWRPQQVQDFMPTPMTLATDMYYSGYHVMSGKPIHVVRDMRDKAMQRALLRWADPQSRPLVDEALRRTGRRPAREGQASARPRRPRRGARPPRA